MVKAYFRGGAITAVTAYDDDGNHCWIVVSRDGSLFTYRASMSAIEIRKEK